MMEYGHYLGSAEQCLATPAIVLNAPLIIPIIAPLKNGYGTIMVTQNGGEVVV